MTKLVKNLIIGGSGTVTVAGAGTGVGVAVSNKKHDNNAAAVKQQAKQVAEQQAKQVAEQHAKEVAEQHAKELASIAAERNALELKKDNSKATEEVRVAILAQAIEQAKIDAEAVKARLSADHARTIEQETDLVNAATMKAINDAIANAEFDRAVKKDSLEMKKDDSRSYALALSTIAAKLRSTLVDAVAEGFEFPAYVERENQIADLIETKPANHDSVVWAEKSLEAVKTYIAWQTAKMSKEDLNFKKDESESFRASLIEVAAELRSTLANAVAKGFEFPAYVERENQIADLIETKPANHDSVVWAEKSLEAVKTYIAWQTAKMHREDLNFKKDESESFRAGLENAIAQAKIDAEAVKARLSVDHARTIEEETDLINAATEAAIAKAQHEYDMEQIRLLEAKKAWVSKKDADKAAIQEMLDLARNFKDLTDDQVSKMSETEFNAYIWWVLHSEQLDAFNTQVNIENQGSSFVYTTNNGTVITFANVDELISAVITHNNSRQTPSYWLRTQHALELRQDALDTPAFIAKAIAAEDLGRDIQNANAIRTEQTAKANALLMERLSVDHARTIEEETDLINAATEAAIAKAQHEYDMEQIRLLEAKKAWVSKKDADKAAIQEMLDLARNFKDLTDDQVSKMSETEFNAYIWWVLHSEQLDAFNTQVNIENQGSSFVYTTNNGTVITFANVDELISAVITHNNSRQTPSYWLRTQHALELRQDALDTPRFLADLGKDMENVHAIRAEQTAKANALLMERLAADHARINDQAAKIAATFEAFNNYKTQIISDNVGESFVPSIEDVKFDSTKDLQQNIAILDAALEKGINAAIDASKNDFDSYKAHLLEANKDSVAIVKMLNEYTFNPHSTVAENEMWLESQIADIRAKEAVIAHNNKVVMDALAIYSSTLEHLVAEEKAKELAAEISADRSALTTKKHAAAQAELERQVAHQHEVELANAKALADSQAKIAEALKNLPSSISISSHDLSEIQGMSKDASGFITINRDNISRLLPSLTGSLLKVDSITGIYAHLQVNADNHATLTFYVENANGRSDVPSDIILTVA